jgi:hypothetical protein
MHRRLWSVAASAGLLLSTACYHATVETGRSPGTTVVSKPWVSTFLWGLVPAKDIDVSAQCPSGIARVETQQTFVNGLVGAVTLGIYTPQSATITCAASRAGALPAELQPSQRSLPVVGATDTTYAARRVAVQTAVETSARTHGAVLVRF